MVFLDMVGFYFDECLWAEQDECLGVVVFN